MQKDHNLIFYLKIFGYYTTLISMSDIQVKQQFLRAEILDAGIDPGEFLAFLVAANSKKGENLELWKI